MAVQLTKEQLDALQGMETEFAVIEGEIKRAEDAGLDVKELTGKLAEMRKVRAGLLRVYGGVTVTRRVY